ncbi:Helicase SKI2W [Auxenochlorella protothecoides]|uniref:Helicase SKI2W n=1 Tax=Auxenochlorella protothecoides TaxID=3075 RepID=A0A087SIT4_AUXPR|nr:Helicase SKI2W [Auxenochlorella protothecoides]KFM25638.1 Helicase SKI2W [Auxenochlorella protothecoides]
MATAVTCKSLVYEKPGDPVEVLSLKESPVPSPSSLKDGQILIKLIASPINPSDINTVEGKYPLQPELPGTPGNDGLGRVEAVGPKVSGLSPGDQVVPVAACPGTWRSHAVAAASNWLRVPPTLSPEAACALSINPPTALLMLRDYVDLAPGDVVIQNGGNSAVGRLVSQLAARRGLRAVSVVRGRGDAAADAELARELEGLGAALVTTPERLKADLAAAGLPPPRLGLDCVGGEVALALAKTLEKGGTLVTYGAMSKQPLAIPAPLLIFKDLRFRGFWASGGFSKDEEGLARKREVLKEVADLFEEGALDAPKFKRVALEDWKEALESIKDGRLNSKLVFYQDNGIWLAEEEEGSEGSKQSDGTQAAAAEGTQDEPASDVPATPSPLEDILGVQPGDLGWAPGPGSLAPLTNNAPVSKTHGAPLWVSSNPVPDLARRWAALAPGLARTWPFELDVFQKEAIVHMEAGRSVFVAAHTSAGKTVVAEYALALASRHATRAVYTSPIKTISNQKFRDFGAEFDVGLLTGDVQINPDASCLIMTTEILRSMLYKGADVVRDIEWVVFDEVHYVNDAERGVVWEEVIIMLPPHVKLVLLSATVPNVLEFADWVGRTKRQVIHVTGTTRRPTPLEHSLYHGGQLHTICRGEAQEQALVDAYAADGWRGGAREKGRPLQEIQRAKDQIRRCREIVRECVRTCEEAEGDTPIPASCFDEEGELDSDAIFCAKCGNREADDDNDIVLCDGPCNRAYHCKCIVPPLDVSTLTEDEGWLCPACDHKLLHTTPQTLDFTSSSEKSEIHLFCEKCFARLTGTDRQLPQVLRVTEMLKRGLGVHHAGLLPIVKEVVEMLFCRGIIKVLLATETFAMGVNAPARTVVFQSLRKHDGHSFRPLLSGEYTQMAGRAGRRGLDAVGTVIVAAWDELPQEGDIRRLLTGSATRLESQFRLTYSMILNLLRVEDLKVEDMLRRSFAEFHVQRRQPELTAVLEEGQEALRKLRARSWPRSPLGTTREAVEAYYDVCAEVARLDSLVQGEVAQSRAAAAALAHGRLALVTHPGSGLVGLGVVVEGGAGGGRAAPGPRPAGGGAEAEGPARTMLMLYSPGPRDEYAGAGEVQRDTAEPAPAAQPAPPPGLKLMGKKKNDDDDLLLMGKGGKKGGKKKPVAALATPALVLPHRGSVAGAQYLIAEVPLRCITGICRQRLADVDGPGVLHGTPAALSTAVSALLRAQAEAGPSGEPETLDPATDLKLQSYEVVRAARERTVLAAQRGLMAAHSDPLLPEMYAMIRSEKVLTQRLSVMVKRLSNDSLAQLPEFHQRVGVLQRLGYLDADRMVTLKGRVACELNSGDELAATELVYGGVLTDLEPEEAVALLSALEKTQAEVTLPPRLAEARDRAMDLAEAAGVLQAEAGLQLEPVEWAASVLRFGLAEVVYEWARGTPFHSICELTDVMEGTIVRAIVRLDETCREFRDAARIMGNVDLFKQMEAASECIKRDVIFAASLYVT